MGIYVLLSAVALTALLAALNRKLDHNIRLFLRDDLRRQMLTIRDELTHRDVAGSGEFGSRESDSGESDFPVARLWLRHGQTLLHCGSDAGVISTACFQAPAMQLTAAVRRRLIAGAMRDEVHTTWDFLHPATLYAAMRLPGAGADDRFAILAWDAGERLSFSVESRETAVRVALVAWICGTASLAIVVAAIVAPMRRLMTVLRQRDDAAERRDLLIRLGERSDEFGQVARAVAAIDQDRADRLKQARVQEQQMRSSAVQLSAMLQSMAEGVIAVDADERVLFANDVACSMLELDPDNLKGRPIFEVVRNTHFQEVVHEAVSERKPTEMELRVSRNNAVVALSASPISGSGAVLVLADITEMRKLESMRRDFVSGVSHELKTPLTVIKACTETLLDGAVEDTEAARRFLLQIEEQSERLLQLILRMLQLARVESGQRVLEKQPVDLAAGSDQVIHAMQPVAAGKNISLTREGEAELFVLADDQAVQTVLGSLIDNSLKYTPEGGVVRVTVHADESAALVSVIDNGVGIPRQEQQRIFERFYRVERDRNRERGGTGLGLAIVKHLCQAMGADVSLDSAVGKGCTITVRFPFQD